VSRQPKIERFVDASLDVRERNLQMVERRTERHRVSLPHPHAVAAAPELRYGAE
jgi:hypothetical protein